MNNKKNKWFCISQIMTLIVLIFAMGCDIDEEEVIEDLTIETVPHLGEVTVLTDSYTENLYLYKEKKYLLRGPVKITDGAFLSIEPGTTIYGESGSNSILIIMRGSRIYADGEATAPIVFTSDQPENMRSRGQWGGLVINGNAPIYKRRNGFGKGNTGAYGGGNASDNSGVLRYVRVEYAGKIIKPEIPGQIWRVDPEEAADELNGISLQGVGSSTVIDYIQSHMSMDDGIQIYGGTVDITHAVVTGAADDSFDWSRNWQGHGKYWIAQQYDDKADNGIEGKGNYDKERWDIEPDHFSDDTPHISNITLVGGNTSKHGIILTGMTEGSMMNMIIIGFDYAGADILSSYVFPFHGLVMHNNRKPWSTGEFTEIWLPESEYVWYDDPDLVDPYNKSNPNFEPSGLDAFVKNHGVMFWREEPGSVIGAADQADNWYQHWTNFKRR